MKGCVLLIPKDTSYFMPLFPGIDIVCKNTTGEVIALDVRVLTHRRTVTLVKRHIAARDFRESVQGPRI